MVWKNNTRVFLQLGIALLLIFGWSADLHSAAGGRKTKKAAASAVQQDELNPELISAAVNQVRLQIDDQLFEHHGATRVLLFGNTRAGKSTLGNALIGHRLNGAHKDGEYVLNISPDVRGFKVTPFMGSETAIPQGLPAVRSVKTSVFRGEITDDLIIWDLPGFFDNRGHGQQIVNTYAIDELLKPYAVDEFRKVPSKLKCILLVEEFNFDEVSLHGLIEKLDVLMTIFPDEMVPLSNGSTLRKSTLESGLSIVVGRHNPPDERKVLRLEEKKERLKDTQDPEEQEDLADLEERLKELRKKKTARERVERALERLKETGNPQYTRHMSLLSAILSRTDDEGNNIGIYSFPICTGEGPYELFTDREDVLKDLRRNPIVNPKHHIQFAPDVAMSIAKVLTKHADLERLLLPIIDKIQNAYRRSDIDEATLEKWLEAFKEIHLLCTTSEQAADSEQRRELEESALSKLKSKFQENVDILDITGELRDLDGCQRYIAEVVPFCKTVFA